MHLSLRRIGWTSTSALTFRDDYNREISLAYTSPFHAFVFFLDLATQRSHERAFAESTDGFQGTRVCVEPLKKLLGPKGKGLSQREKYLALTVFCQGVWTRARARA
eukprot:9487632-Pyramimonas_sp.AAC.1